MRPLFVAPLLFLVLLPGCHKRHERVSVAVSVFPLYDLVRRTVGPDADVVLVLSPPAARAGAGSVSTWTPPPEVEAQVAKANILVAVGLGLDPWMDALLPHAAPKATLIKLGDRVPTITSEDGSIDGHVWMDPQRAGLIVNALAEDLGRADSSHAIAFRDRAVAVDASLTALDKEIEARTSAWTKRESASLPPSMAYYAERYSLPTRKPRSAPSPSAQDSQLDVYGGGGPSGTSETYEELLRADTAVLDTSLR